MYNKILGKFYLRQNVIFCMAANGLNIPAESAGGQGMAISEPFFP